MTFPAHAASPPDARVAPSTRSRPPRRVLALALALVTVAATAVGCRRGDAGIPTGDPRAVVAAAPQRTAEWTVRVVVASEGRELGGRLDLSSGSGSLTEAGDGARVDVGWAGRLRTDDPFDALDLVRGARDVEPVGGRQVRGSSALEYEISVDVAHALAKLPASRRQQGEAAAAGLARTHLDGGVWVDSAGRVRRIQLPTHLESSTPVTARNGKEAVTTVDFYDFTRTPGGGGDAAGQP